MKKGKKIARITSQSLKLVTLASLGILFAFIVNHYYQIKNYAETLSEELNVFVFFDKNLEDEDEKKILEAINSQALLSIKEYVNSIEAYKKTVEKNPLLNNLSLPNDSKSMQAYAIAKPESIPDDNFLLEMRSILEGINGIDEIVFDTSNFLHYAKIQKHLLVYKKVFFVIILVFFTFLVLKFVLAYIAGADMLKSMKRFFLYFLTSSLGFLLFWILCTRMHYSLLISETAIMILIPFTSVVGVMFDKIETEAE
ncbi:MAG: hypothetical protein LBD17_01655 [Endomicrobium sp.]|jgi:cell division protein FtsX|nr:hypothetical protein [Endomicrobium sp.]